MIMWTMCKFWTWLSGWCRDVFGIVLSGEMFSSGVYKNGSYVLRIPLSSFCSLHYVKFSRVCNIMRCCTIIDLI
jgi:hypothetical protein